MLIKAKRCKIQSPESVARVLQKSLRAESMVDREKEHFWAVGLDTGCRIKYIDMVSLGIADAGLVHPRETYRVAVMMGVTRVITAHSHPSGDLRFSSRDQQCIKKLSDAGEVLGIRMIDHLIITETGFRSLMQNKRPR